MRRRTVVPTAAFLSAAILVLLVGIYGQAPAWDGPPDAIARTGVPPAINPYPIGLPAYAVMPYGTGLAPTPPMGWNGYNHYTREVNDAIVRKIARTLVSSGMAALGYNFVNLDGGWDLPTRGSGDNLLPDHKKFPYGIKPLADFVHSLGLKFGIYTSAGYWNCAGTTAGSYGHYLQDAQEFASWGVDYVKLDWCHMPATPPYTFAGHLGFNESLAREFGDAILQTGRPMVLDANDWIDPPAIQWANYLGNLWRTAPDINDSYKSMVSNFIRDLSYRNAGPDHWNDPDMLEVGNGGMTIDEQRTQFSLWAEMAAPLIAGNDLSDMSPEAFSILTNASVIGVDQDPLGVQGYAVTDKNGHWVLARPLQSGNRAIVLFNQSDKPARIKTTVAEIGLTGAHQYQLQNLWTAQVTWTKKVISAVVPPHSVLMYIVAPAA